MLYKMVLNNLFRFYFYIIIVLKKNFKLLETHEEIKG